MTYDERAISALTEYARTTTAVPRRESDARALTAAQWAFLVADVVCLIVWQLALVWIFIAFSLACGYGARRLRRAQTATAPARGAGTAAEPDASVSPPRPRSRRATPTPKENQR